MGFRDIFKAELFPKHYAKYAGLLQNTSIYAMRLKEAVGRFFIHFREDFEKCIEYIGFQGDFEFS